MIKVLDTIVLSHNIDEYNLKENDIGTVVHCYRNNEAFEVEFVTGEGDTVAVLTLDSKDVREIRQKEILHVREFGADSVFDYETVIYQK
jgi:hypothetical protein